MTEAEQFPSALLGEGGGEGASPSIPPDYRLDSYDYHLPRELIAQTPADPRDSARLMKLDRRRGHVSHHVVSELPGLLQPGDLLIGNRTRVIPARLKGRKAGTGGEVELLLLRPTENGWWEAMVGGHRLRPGQRFEVEGGATVELGDRWQTGYLVRFPDTQDVSALLHAHGSLPLPPYIRDFHGDPERYQTVYAEVEGSVAAPTAGLHFTPALFQALIDRGLDWATIILHVGIGTFQTVSAHDVRDHQLHSERVEVGPGVVEAVEATRARGGRVIAVGTTTVRALEHAASSGRLCPYTGPADLFIMPGYEFRVIDGLMTNFHLPHSSLLLLVSALTGRERLLSAYASAMKLRYRFYSFGDAMLIL